RRGPCRRGFAQAPPSTTGRLWAPSLGAYSRRLRSATRSASVVEPRTCLTAWSTWRHRLSVEQAPTRTHDSFSSRQATGARLPSRSCTTSRLSIWSTGRARRYPPRAPRTDSTIPARRSEAKICSRYCWLRSWRSATVLRLTGSSPASATSTSARMPYGALVETHMGASPSDACSCVHRASVATNLGTIPSTSVEVCHAGRGGSTRRGTHAAPPGAGTGPRPRAAASAVRGLQRLLEVAEGVDGHGAESQLEVQVRPGRGPGRADEPDHVALPDDLAGHDAHGAEVGVAGLAAVAVVE